MALSRREFFEKAKRGLAVAGVLAVHGAELDASPLGLPIGSQTWPHREAMKRDLRGLLKQLADLGVRQIELCSPLGYEEFTGLPKKTFTAAKTGGVKNYFVEQNMDMTRESVAFLKTLNV